MTNEAMLLLVSMALLALTAIAMWDRANWRAREWRVRADAWQELAEEVQSDLNALQPKRDKFGRFVRK